jgi:hypothetical protein
VRYPYRPCRLCGCLDGLHGDAVAEQVIPVNAIADYVALLVREARDGTA